MDGHDPYAEPSDFDMALQQERARITDAGAMGGAENVLKPARVRRIYSPFRPAGVGTISTNMFRDVRHVLQGATPRTDRDVLQDALVQSVINLSSPRRTSTPAGVGSISPLGTPPSLIKSNHQSKKTT